MSGLEFVYTFVRARCIPKPDGNLKRYHYTCAVHTVNPTTGAISTRPDLQVADYCADKYICQNWDYETMDFHAREDIKCMSQEKVNTERMHVGVAVPGGAAECYCAEEKMVLRSSDWQYGGNQKGVNLIVTEEVMYPKGLDFTAPSLLIRDKTSPFGFDRVTKNDASVATTQLALRRIGRTQVQQRKLEFCVKLAPRRLEYWVILMYSWLPSSGRRGRVPVIQMDQPMPV